MAGANTGLFGQIQDSLGTVVELLRLRLALLGTELGMEKQRLAAGLFWGACAIVSLTVAIVLFCGFVILLLWDGYRLAAVGVLALLFLWVGWSVASRTAQAERKVQLFSVSLAELERDRDSFTPQRHMSPADLQLRQQRLLIRSTELRLQLRADLQRLQGPAAWADQVKSALLWLYQNPLWPTAVLVLLLVLNPAAHWPGVAGFGGSGNLPPFASLAQYPGGVSGAALRNAAKAWLPRCGLS